MQVEHQSVVIRRCLVLVFIVLVIQLGENGIREGDESTHNMMMIIECFAVLKKMPDAVQVKGRIDLMGWYGVWSGDGHNMGLVITSLRDRPY